MLAIGKGRLSAQLASWAYQSILSILLLNSAFLATRPRHCMHHGSRGFSCSVEDCVTTCYIYSIMSMSKFCLFAQDSVDGMIQHLASLANRQIILSFAPKTLYYSVLKRIGEFFPGPSRVCPLIHLRLAIMNGEPG